MKLKEEDIRKVLDAVNPYIVRYCETEFIPYIRKYISDAYSIEFNLSLDSATKLLVETPHVIVYDNKEIIATILFKLFEGKDESFKEGFGENFMRFLRGGFLDGIYSNEKISITDRIAIGDIIYRLIESINRIEGFNKVEALDLEKFIKGKIEVLRVKQTQVLELNQTLYEASLQGRIGTKNNSEKIFNHKEALDYALSCFLKNITPLNPQGVLPRKVLKDHLEIDKHIINPDSILNDLIKDGYITENFADLQVTLKGVDFLNTGGYSAKQANSEAQQTIQVIGNGNTIGNIAQANNSSQKNRVAQPDNKKKTFMTWFTIIVGVFTIIGVIDAILPKNETSKQLSETTTKGNTNPKTLLMGINLNPIRHFTQEDSIYFIKRIKASEEQNNIKIDKVKIMLLSGSNSYQFASELRSFFGRHHYSVEFGTVIVNDPESIDSMKCELFVNELHVFIGTFGLH